MHSIIVLAGSLPMIIINMETIYWAKNMFHFSLQLLFQIFVALASIQ
jgi:hypothetical protein